MRYNGTEDSGNVASGERHSSLGSLSIITLLARQTMINHLDDRLERRELHHRVWDLATPKGIQAFVQSIGNEHESVLFRFGTHPALPSIALIVEMPSSVPDAKGGIVVCVRTLTASNGQRAISAKNSAEAEALR